MSVANKRHTYYGTGISYSGLQQNASQRSGKRVTFGPYVIGSTLGEGEFGKVKLGWPKHHTTTDIPKQVAIKLIKRSVIDQDSVKEIKLYREINALKQLSHPNIIKLEEVLQNSKCIGMVMEYASGGEFYKYIQKNKRLKECTARNLFAQLISGVNYMHCRGLVHRDLKLENLLLDEHENLIITDFGFVNQFASNDEIMKTSCGSPCYAAPEIVMSSKPYEARKADIWSCGVILFAMLAGYLPWDDDPSNPDGEDLLKLYRYITSTGLKFPDYIDPIPRDLLRNLLMINPKKRFTMTNIICHEWLRSYKAFLSISPIEWDNLTQNHKVKSRDVKPNRKNRPLSCCSNNSKRNSIIMESALSIYPVPPQQFQSHIMTKLSSGSIEIKGSPTILGHTRNNSAASFALQTVVDVERRRRYSTNQVKVTTDSSIHHLSPQQHMPKTPRPVSYHPRTGSQGYSGGFNDHSHSGLSIMHARVSSADTCITQNSSLFETTPQRLRSESSMASPEMVATQPANGTTTYTNWQNANSELTRNVAGVVHERLETIEKSSRARTDQGGSNTAPSRAKRVLQFLKRRSVLGRG